MNDSAEGNCAVTSRLSVPKASPKQSGIALGVCEEAAAFVLPRGGGGHVCVRSRSGEVAPGRGRIRLSWRSGAESSDQKEMLSLNLIVAPNYTPNWL